MKELLTRTLSGTVLVALIIGSIFLSPWVYAALMLFAVTVGTLEMANLQGVTDKAHRGFGLFFDVGLFALLSLVALSCLPLKYCLFTLLFLSMPFLLALFSKQYDFKTIAAFCYGSMCFVSIPAALMLFFYRQDLFGELAGPGLLLLVFALLWVNDTFAYLTGRLLGKHKLFERISPGKTIEGSAGGLVFTLIGILIYSHYIDALPYATAIGLTLVAVVFGTLGDLSESMLKRQVGVKDSGHLIPGHGGILDRFDSVFFAVPFVFVYLLLL